MANVDAVLAERGLSLPEPWILPPGVTIPAETVRISGDRVFVSGHVPLDGSGRVSGPFGAVGGQVSLEQARDAARAAILGVFASLRHALGDLDRIAAWSSMCGMVRCAAGFTDFPKVIDPASELVLAVFGGEVGAHARVAIGVAGLPWDAPVEIQCELLLGG